MKTRSIMMLKIHTVASKRLVWTEKIWMHAEGFGARLSISTSPNLIYLYLAEEFSYLSDYDSRQLFWYSLFACTSEAFVHGLPINYNISILVVYTHEFFRICLDLFCAQIFSMIISSVYIDIVYTRANRRLLAYWFHQLDTERHNYL